MTLAEWDLIAQFVQAFAIGFVGWAAWEQRQHRLLEEKKREESRKEGQDG